MSASLREATELLGRREMTLRAINRHRGMLSLVPQLRDSQGRSHSRTLAEYMRYRSIGEVTLLVSIPEACVHHPWDPGRCGTARLERRYKSDRCGEAL